MRMTRAQLQAWKKKRPDLFGDTEERGRESKRPAPDESDQKMKLRSQKGRNIYIKNGQMRIENGWVIPWNYQEGRKDERT